MTLNTGEYAEQEFSFTADVNPKWQSHFGRQLLVKLNKCLCYNPVISLLCFTQVN